MAKDQPLNPDCFPVKTQDTKILDHNGKKIADASDPNTAEEIADRLNTEEERREEDRWSA
jgi:gamma-glutamyl phosphate reductase